jgi:hypothetical protein
MAALTAAFGPSEANAAIATVNLNARLNVTRITAVDIVLDEGTYVASPAPRLGPDAWNAWGWVSVDSSGEYEPGDEGWLNSYVIEVDGVRHDVWDGLIHPTAAAAFASMQPYEFDVFVDASTVLFYIDDFPLFRDNVGGLSLEISNVPIPGAIWLLGSGVLGLTALRRRKTR